MRIQPPGYSGGPATCFLADSLVLLGDGGWKKIQDVQRNDLLMTPAGESRCKYLFTTTLGPCRQVMTFEEDPSFAMVSDHLLWAQQEGRQSWWCGDMAQLQRELLSGLGTPPDLNDFFEGEVEYAHITGFVKRTPKVVMDVPAETPVYLPCLDGPPGIVNGYLTACFLNSTVFDTTSLDWNLFYPALKEHYTPLERHETQP